MAHMKLNLFEMSNLAKIEKIINNYLRKEGIENTRMECLRRISLILILLLNAK